jgi:hypothetical protein
MAAKINFILKNNVKYYLFKVNDSLGQEYYVLNNQFIGYIGFDSNDSRRKEEHDKKIVYNNTEYVLIAQTNYIEKIHPVENYLHKLNCESTRFTKDEAEDLIKRVCQFYRNPDATIYLEYFPDKNSSECWLREKNWRAKKDFKEIK